MVRVKRRPGRNHLVVQDDRVRQVDTTSSKHSTIMSQSITDILGEHGPFTLHVEGFAVRRQQQQMAQAIADLLQGDSDLVVEAGTGTGKTFAYLVPVMLSGRKVIVSTGTKNLQDQLFKRDIPVVRKALNVPVTCALLKGRANYLCRHRLDLALETVMQFEPRHMPALQSIRDWSAHTHEGDIADCQAVPETDFIWPRVTSTADNCLGNDCNYYQECFVLQARRAAQAADVVVINHHLLLSDMALQEEGFGELLPAADAYVIDEAHQLPEIAAQFFGIGTSTQQFVDLATDSQRTYLQDINETTEMEHVTGRLDKAARDVRLLFGDPMGRGSWRDIAGRQDVIQALTELQETAQQLETVLAPLAERSKDLENCHKRCVNLLSRLMQITQEASENDIQWYEVHRRSVSFHLTPLDIAGAFIEHKSRKGGNWIFTSATLTVDHDFSHFTRRLGVVDAATRQWDSPFDYATQTLLYLPDNMPDPNAPNYTARVIDVAKQVLRASEGRAFLLFTSYRALRQAENVLREHLPYPLLVQGEASRDHLLATFRNTEHAVLLGTSSFWEGVDVRGEALSCVIIDKLPFAAPTDPVLQARLDSLRRQGLNPFMTYQLPSAVITLKQGVGRLIRDPADRGVLVLCDPRLLGKSYGKTFLNSLPKMPLTRQLRDVNRFFASDSTRSEVGR